jgi:hypothetical protein
VWRVASLRSQFSGDFRALRVFSPSCGERVLFATSLRIVKQKKPSAFVGRLASPAPLKKTLSRSLKKKSRRAVALPLSFFFFTLSARKAIIT